MIHDIKKKVLIPIVLFFLTCSGLVNALQHPGLLDSKAELDFVKEQIANKKNPWFAEFERIRKENPENHNPNATKVIPSARSWRKTLFADGKAAYNSALLWYYTGEKKYADNAIKILNAWSIFERNDHELWHGWALPWFLNAAELMIHLPNTPWQKADQEKFVTMVRTKMLPQYSNHNAWRNNAMLTVIEVHMAAAILIDSQTEFEDALKRWRAWTPAYVYSKLDGPTPKVVGKSGEIWDAKKYYDGQCQEICRDWDHMKLGMNSLMFAAEMAFHQGVDVWSQEKARLAAFAEFQAGMSVGAINEPKDMCDAGRIYCIGAVKGQTPKGSMPCKDKNGPGTWEMLYTHINNRLGHDLPNLRKMLGSDNRSSERVNETMTHGNLPASIYANAPILSITSPEHNAKKGMNIGSLPGGTVELTFSMSSSKSVNAAIYTRRGELLEKIHLGKKSAGTHKAVLHTSTLTPGVYLLRLEYEGEYDTQFLTVIR